MPTIEEDKKRYMSLKNQLTVLNLFENTLSLSKKEKEIVTDAALDEMIVLLKRIRNYEKSKKNE